MALEGRIDIRETFPASTDLSTNQYHFVTIDGSGQLALAGAGARAFVLVDKPDAAGETGTVIVVGKTKVVAGGTISAGNNVTPDASGEAVVAATGDEICGIAMEDAAAGELCQVLVVNGGVA